MESNIFFKKKKIKLGQLFSKIKLKENFFIKDVKPLHIAQKNDITFFDSQKYKDIAFKTKASACITSNNLEKYFFNLFYKSIFQEFLLALLMNNLNY